MECTRYRNLLLEDLPAEEFVGEPPIERVTKPGPTLEDIIAQKAEQKIWSENNNKAAQLIVSKYDDKPSDFIEDENFAQEMWEKLEKLYQDSGFTSWHTILQQLMCTTISNYNNSVDRIFGQETGLGTNNVHAKNRTMRQS